ncbi:unnamed protein product [Ixodes persulcatus]
MVESYDFRAWLTCCRTLGNVEFLLSSDSFLCMSSPFPFVFLLCCFTSFYLFYDSPE